MRLNNTTAVPNRFFDELMIELSASAVRVYLKIVRNTNGWRDANGYPKQRDWISHSQFGNVGVSSRSVTSAIEELLSHNLIILTDDNGNSLHNPQERKRAKRIYYALNSQDNAKNTITKVKNYKNNANSVLTPTQNLHTTKEISTKEYSVEKGQRTSDHIRIQQLKDQEQRMQLKRNNWF